MKTKCANTMNKIISHFDKEMRDENLPYIVKKMEYYKDLYQNLNAGKLPNDYDLGNLIKLEDELKKKKGISLDEMVSRFQSFCEELHMEGMAKLADNVMNYDHDKLFNMAQWNDNRASMIRIEHEFGVTLDKTMKRRLPQLRELALKHNITIKF